MNNINKPKEGIELVIEKALSIGKKGLIIGAIGLSTFVLGVSSHYYNDSGISTRVQQPFMGVRWDKTEGHKFYIPFASRQRSYNQVGTFAATDNADLIAASSISEAPVAMQFADTYEMGVEWSMRYRIGVTDIQLEAMHVQMINQQNMLGNTIMPFGASLVKDTVNQMLGEFYAQGGRNQLRTLVNEQTAGGMYVTEVRKVPTERSASGGKGSNATVGGANSQAEITEVVYQTDEDPKSPTFKKRLRTPLSISAYGLTIVPNSFQLVETKSLGKLVKLLETKQTNVQLQLDQDEKQKLLAKQTYTEKLQGEKTLVTRTNILNIQKQEAIIAGEKEVEMATLAAEKQQVDRQNTADLAIIDKTREQQVATANLEIEKSNYSASVYEAKAMKEKGFAEAAIAKAKLAAKTSNMKVYLAEINRDTVLGQARSMEKTSLSSPESVIINNGVGQGSTALADLVNVKLVKDITGK